MIWSRSTFQHPHILSQSDVCETTVAKFFTTAKCRHNSHTLGSAASNCGVSDGCSCCSIHGERDIFLSHLKSQYKMYTLIQMLRHDKMLKLQQKNYFYNNVFTPIEGISGVLLYWSFTH